MLPLDILGELVSIGTLAAFVIVCVGVMVLRVEPAERARGRSARRSVWVVAPLGIAMCLFMMVFLPLDTWIRLGVWTVIGLVIYFTYSIHHVQPPRWKLVDEPRPRPNSMSDDAHYTQPNPVVAEDHELHRALGPVSLIMIGIGSIIGAGIFVIAGTAAAEHAGPAVHVVLRHRRAGLPVRRSLLRRIRLDDPGIRQRLYLCLRHHGPLHGVVHRLEHGAGISRLGLDGRRSDGQAIS